MGEWLRRRRRLREESGATAVEFALVSVILFPIMFGIMQYGIFFNDSLQARQGIRQATRTAIVQGAPATGCTAPTYTTVYAQVKCSVKAQTNPVTGAVAVMIKVPDTGSWVQGNRLIVCSEVKSAASSVGLLPVPKKGVIRTKTQMSIEVDTPAVTGTPVADTSLSGSWSWCV